jgi:CBS domain-containing protein
MRRKIIPDVVSEQELTLLNERVSVLEAVELMAQRRIGAVMIASNSRLTGIFTERDLLMRVVAPGLDPARVTLGEAMTRNPDTLAPDDEVHNALDLMSRRGYRHLPVVDDGRVVGMVSVRDLYAAVLHEMEDEIHDRDAFIHGTGYGLGN